MWVRFDMCNTAILAVECCSENDGVELLRRFDTVVEINKLQKLEGALVEQMLLLTLHLLPLTLYRLILTLY